MTGEGWKLLGNPTIAESSDEVKIEKSIQSTTMAVPGDVHSNLGFQKENE